MNITAKEIPTTSGIYKFINTQNSKIYIGSAKDLRKRFVQHISALRLNSHHSKHFQNAWNKYGENNFIYEIIEFVEIIDTLLEREQYYLDTLLFAQEYIRRESNKFLELGYNINPCAMNRLGTIQKLESINKSIQNNNKVLPVIHYSFDGTKLNEYISTGEASKITGINRSSIWACCKHETNYTKGGFFIFKNEENLYKEYFESLHDSPFIIQPWNKGLKTGKVEKNECVILFDRYGRYIKKFTHQSDLAKFIKSTPANISKYKNNKVHKNYLFYDINFDYEPIISKLREDYWYVHNITPCEYKHILMFDNFDNFIVSFNTTEEASEFTELNRNSIYNVLCGKRKQIKGFKFKYFEDIV